MMYRGIFSLLLSTVDIIHMLLQAVVLSPSSSAASALAALVTLLPETCRALLLDICAEVLDSPLFSSGSGVYRIEGSIDCNLIFGSRTLVCALPLKFRLCAFVYVYIYVCVCVCACVCCLLVSAFVCMCACVCVSRVVVV